MVEVSVTFPAATVTAGVGAMKTSPSVFDDAAGLNPLKGALISVMTWVALAEDRARTHKNNIRQ